MRFPANMVETAYNGEDYLMLGRDAEDEPLKIKLKNVTELLELPVAEVLNVLYAKIQALEAFIKTSQYGNVTADQVDVVRNFNIWGKTNLIIEGTAAPAVVPDFVGQQFINTTAGVTYTAKGNTSVADWKQTSN